MKVFLTILALGLVAQSFAQELIVGQHADKKFCFLMYFTNGSLIVPEIPKTLSFKNNKDEFSFNQENFNCEKVDAKKDANGKANYYSRNITLTLAKDATVDIQLANAEGHWRISNMKATVDKKVYEGKDFISSPSGFSRSCQTETFVLTREEPDDKGKKTFYATLAFARFQLQPFVRGEFGDVNTMKFNDSSDCSQWFTLPLIMGLIVVLILLAILYSGVLALMSISTPDRFENPKGKGLIITNFDE